MTHAMFSAHLADMHQPFDAWADFDESPKVGDPSDRAAQAVSDLDSRVFPGIGRGLSERE